MAYEPKNLTGALFNNDNKERESQPDFTGNVKIGDKLWRLAGWNTESRAGTPYISLKVTDPAEYQRQRESEQRGQVSRPTGRLSQDEFNKKREQMRPRPNPEHDFDDDDIPF